jgi:hypothetical protein
MLTVLLPDHFNHTSQRIVFVMANGVSPATHACMHVPIPPLTILSVAAGVGHCSLAEFTCLPFP